MKFKGIELKGTYELKETYKVICYATSFEVYNEKDHLIYYEDSNGYWSKWEYDEKGNEIYFENSNNYWEKSEYDEKGNQIYYEDSNGYWDKREYNENGNEIHYENSKGEIIDKRVKELTIEEIEKLLGYKIKIKGE